MLDGLSQVGEDVRLQRLTCDTKGPVGPLISRVERSRATAVKVTDRPPRRA